MSGPRRRDATRTRRLLLEAASRRFATDGYAATTVRTIAEDAGVNVALISRYFDSKEGLFEACLWATRDELDRAGGEQSLAGVPEAIAYQVAGGADLSGRLGLLLRTSGDARAEEIRRAVLRTSAERLAAVAGWSPGDPDEVLLRAQLVLATTIGLAVLRSSDLLPPLTTTAEPDLVPPLRTLVEALLPPAPSDVT